MITKATEKLFEAIATSHNKTDLFNAIQFNPGITNSKSGASLDFGIMNNQYTAPKIDTTKITGTLKGGAGNGISLPNNKIQPPTADEQVAVGAGVTLSKYFQDITKSLLKNSETYKSKSQKGKDTLDNIVSAQTKETFSNIAGNISGSLAATAIGNSTKQNVPIVFDNDSRVQNIKQKAKETFLGQNIVPKENSIDSDNYSTQSGKIIKSATNNINNWKNELKDNPNTKNLRDRISIEYNNAIKSIQRDTKIDNETKSKYIEELNNLFKSNVNM